jgi:hypothetical protein
MKIDVKSEKNWQKRGKKLCKKNKKGSSKWEGIVGRKKKRGKITGF